MAKKKETLEQEIAGLFRAHYRLASSGWVGGENHIRVVIGEQPHATSRSKKVWHKKHAWSGINLDVHLTVSPTWRRSVRARGLAVPDGLLTTHAGPVVRQGDIDVYPATWVRQSLGLTIRPETGWIAYHRPSGTAYHRAGGDAGRAVAALRRKLRNQAVPQEEKDERRRRIREARQARLDALVGQLARHDLSGLADVVVTRQDSLEAGNCEPGTDQFIDTFFPNKTTATIAEIAAVAGRTDLAGLDERELTLARQIAAACQAAIRRHRRERRGG